VIMEVNKPKTELLRNCFSTIFPGVSYSWKNTQGIYDEFDVCATKRSVCFSDVKIDPSALPKEFADRFTSRCVWGLCGIEATRANKADDDLFILCIKPGKHFVAVVIVSISPDPASLPKFVSDKAEIEKVLDCMRKEKKDVNEKKREKKRARRIIEEGETLPTKRKRVRVVDLLIESSHQSSELNKDFSSQSFEPCQQPGEFSSVPSAESVGSCEVDRSSGATERTSSSVSSEEIDFLGVYLEEQSTSLPDDSGNDSSGFYSCSMNDEIH